MILGPTFKRNLLGTFCIYVTLSQSSVDYFHIALEMCLLCFSALYLLAGRLYLSQTLPHLRRVHKLLICLMVG